MALEVVQWIDPDGTPTTLRVQYAVRSRFAPPAELLADVVPGQPGERLREARHGPREFVLPIRLSATSDAQLRTDLRALVAKMDPTRGDGAVRVTAPSGDVREITCRYAAGLDVDETLGDTSTPTDQLAAVVFRASDPYWYATSDTITEYTTGAQATFFPIFPVRLNASEVWADAQVDNTGDLETWPVWDITGPGQTISLRNLTTNKKLDLSGVVLGSGEVATVDTRPGHKTAAKQDGSNLFPNLVGSLWPLRRGNNAVRIEMSGATTASKVRLARKHRWLTP